MSKEEKEEEEELGISNLYIDALLRPRSAAFLGVFSSDTLPPMAAVPKRKRFSLVCNLSKAGEPGTHFVTVLCNAVEDGGRLLYIDSFGLPCTHPDIARFLQRVCRHRSQQRQQQRQQRRRRARGWLHNTTTLQHPLSKYCGFYALLFGLYAEQVKNCHPDRVELSFVDSSEGDLFANDALCIHYIKQLLLALPTVNK
jgi:hypothetical protein